MTTGMDIARKIAEHKPALTRKDKQAGKEEVKRLASLHAAAAIKKLGDIIADRNAPASSKVAAATQLLDRVAGKPVKEDPEASHEREMDKMSEAQLLGMICSTIAGLSQESRNTIAETLLYTQRGIALPDRFVDPEFSETAALRAEEEEERGLPPLEPKKEKRVPRR